MKAFVLLNGFVSFQRCMGLSVYKTAITLDYIIILLDCHIEKLFSTFKNATDRKVMLGFENLNR